MSSVREQGRVALRAEQRGKLSAAKLKKLRAKRDPQDLVELRAAKRAETKAAVPA